MAKTMTFAITHFTVAFSVAYIITGSLVIGGLLALIEPAINTVAYYFHEKAWHSFDKMRVNQHISNSETLMVGH